MLIFVFLVFGFNTILVNQFSNKLNLLFTLFNLIQLLCSLVCIRCLSIRVIPLWIEVVIYEFGGIVNMSSTPGPGSKDLVETR